MPFVRLRLVGLLACWLALFGLFPPVTAAQDNRLILVEDAAYVYIHRLQRRGHLLDLHPTALPYTQREVENALDALDPATLDAQSQRWTERLQALLPQAEEGDDEILFGVALGAGMNLATTKRLDGVRPLRDDVFAFSNADLRFYLEKGPLIAQMGLRHDSFYDQDPDGLDAVKRLYVRGEDGYVGVNTSYFSAYLGRFSQQWGLPGEASSVLSPNARSFDRLALTLGGPRIALRSVLGELDNLDPDGTFTGRGFREGSRRRLLAAHRLDWRPSRYLNLSILESTLFSGPSAGPSLKFLNPLYPHAFETDNTPKNDENNGMVAGLLWFYADPITLHGQFLFDDLDLRGEGQEPISFTLLGSLLWGGFTPTLDLGFSLEVVTARTYNALQTDGQYLYLNRGIATHFTDYVQASLFADWYVDAWLPNLILTPRLTYLAQGEQDLRLPFPQTSAEANLILDGTVAHTMRVALQAWYQPHPWGWVRLEVGFNAVRNANHIEGEDVQRGVLLFAFGLRPQLDQPISLGFRP